MDKVVKQFGQDFINLTINCLTAISVRRGKNFDAFKAEEYMKDTHLDKIKQAWEESHKDMKAASFGLETKKPTSLQKQVFQVSFTHSATKWAEEVLDKA